MTVKDFLMKNVSASTIIVILLIILIIAALDIRLKKAEYNIESDKIKDKVTLAVVSDLHGCYYGKNQKTLVNKISKSNPDAILLAGDIFDDEVPYKHSEKFLEQISGKYPIYFVTGNHEYFSNEPEVILEKISSYGITILNGSTDILEVKGEKIQISGITDIYAASFVANQIGYKEQLDNIETKISKENFSVLVAHRPELINEYLNYSYDLVVSGHAHGGQWRIPFILNGLYAPSQGFFPKYAGGLYKFSNLDFIVSRGLARESTAFVPRIFNRPELVIVNISKKSI